MPAIYTVEEIQELLLPVLKQNGVKRAVLFGSYGKGAATEKSDIDLLVDSGLCGLSFLGLLDQLQTVLGKEVDLLDISHIEAGSPVDREIQSSGIVVYEASPFS